MLQDSMAGVIPVQNPLGVFTIFVNSLADFDFYDARLSVLNNLAMALALLPKA
jgi:hypothetical protein